MKVGLKWVEPQPCNMPVTEVDLANDIVGPYNRLSSSQVNTYNSCKRMWYYEKELKFKINQIPVLYVGRAVEEAICRTLKDSPSLLRSTASSETLSKVPIDENGRPSKMENQIWPSERIIKLPESEIPSSIEQLREWALERLKIHLNIALDSAHKEWERQERKSGDWLDVEYDYCFKMCSNAIDFHISEVSRCFSLIDDETLQVWRQGSREDWPSPDGYGYSIRGEKHPLSCQGDVTLCEAWEIARPWFVEPESENFSMNAIHPDYWFQGEYDIVYRWDGRIRIIDIKASKGAGDRSGDYVEQLRMYAMLWWLTHGKNETVSDLEIWYLGANKKKSISVPSEVEMQSMESELYKLWQDIKESNVSIDDCPAEPSALRSFSEGGIPSNALEDKKRCYYCDWKLICSGGEGQDYTLSENKFNIPGNLQSIETIEIGSLNVRFNIKAIVDNVIYSESGKPALNIVQRGYRAKVEFLVDVNQFGNRIYPDNISKGDVILLNNAIITSNYKGELTIKLDPLSEICQPNDGEEYDSLLNYRARWNLVGKLAYKFERKGIGKTGREWHRKGMVIFDKSGSIKISGWVNNWGHQYDMAEVGDNILLSNIELDAWATQIRGQIGRNSRAHLLN